MKELLAASRLRAAERRAELCQQLHAPPGRGGGSRRLAAIPTRLSPEQPRDAERQPGTMNQTATVSHHQVQCHSSRAAKVRPDREGWRAQGEEKVLPALRLGG